MEIKVEKIKNRGKNSGKVENNEKNSVNFIIIVVDIIILKLINKCNV